MKRPELLDMQDSAIFCYCKNKETFRNLAKKYEVPFLKLGKKFLYDKKDLLVLMQKIKQDSTSTLANSQEQQSCQFTKEANTTGRNLERQRATVYTSQPKLHLVERLKNTKQN